MNIEEIDIELDKIKFKVLLRLNSIDVFVNDKDMSDGTKINIIKSLLEKDRIGEKVQKIVDSL